MKTYKVNLPDEIIHVIKTYTNDVSDFIVGSVRKRIEEKSKAKMNKMLIEGYKTNSRESKKLLKEFNKIDLENWDEY